MFEGSDYRQIIASILKERSILQRDVAVSTRIHPAYFSRVLRGQRTHFSEDQLFRICAHLRIATDDADYLALLLRRARSESAAFRRHLDIRIKALQEEHLSVKRRVQEAPPQASQHASEPKIAGEYFQSWIMVEVHLLLGIDTYKRDPSLIPERLAVAPVFVEEAITRLLEIGLIAKEGQGYKRTPLTVHLGEREALSRHHHLNWRLKAVERLQNGLPGYSFTVVATGVKGVRAEIEKRFKAFAKEVYELTKDQDSQEIFHINFDLF